MQTLILAAFLCVTTQPPSGAEAGELCFSAVSLPGLGSPQALHSVHVNNDGQLDLVLSSGTALSVYLGQGGGAFGAPITTAFPGFGQRVDLGDLDGDGCCDLAAADGFSLVVRSGLCDGSFGPATFYAVPDFSSNDCAVDDFDGDGALDVVVSFGDLFCPSGMRLYRGLGDGTLVLAGDASTQVFDVITSGDVNADGRADAFGLFPSNLEFTLGASDFSTTAVLAPFANTFGGLAVGDFDKDGSSDLVGSTGAAIETYLGAEQLDFSNPSVSPLSLGNTRDLVVADFDGDGRLDLAGATALDTVGIVRGLGDGTFESAWSLPLPAVLWTVVGGDFDGDGRTDLAAARTSPDELVILRNETTPSAWVDLGFGLASASGTPLLTGSGGLSAGATTTLTLSNAAPLHRGYVVMGASFLGTPFQGGVLVPAPLLIMRNVPTTAAGTFEHSFCWPAQLPGGAALWFQAWILDSTGPAGWAASNGLVATPG